MSNISFSDKSKKKAVSTETTTVPITNEKYRKEVAMLVRKCEEIIILTNSLYSLKNDKNLSDALVTLELTKDSLELTSLN